VGFGGTYSLHFQGKRLFYLQAGGSRFFQNMSIYRPSGMVSHPKRLLIPIKHTKLFISSLLWTVHNTYVILCFLKSSLLWDIMPCSLLKVNWCFRGTCHLHLGNLIRLSQARNQHEEGSKQSFAGTFLLLASFWFLAWISVQFSRRKWRVPPKHQLTFNRLHGIIFQKIDLFITKVVTTSNPSCFFLSLC
jgi:hypothetical protein